MAQSVENSVAACPLCGEAIDLGVPDWKVASKWRDVLPQRDRWANVSIAFRERQSIPEAARDLALSHELTSLILDFLCTDLCGCRASTCVSCLDDYRSEL